MHECGLNIFCLNEHERGLSAELLLRPIPSFLYASFFVTMWKNALNPHHNHYPKGFWGIHRHVLPPFTQTPTSPFFPVPLPLPVSFSVTPLNNLFVFTVWLESLLTLILSFLLSKSDELGFEKRGQKGGDSFWQSTLGWMTRTSEKEGMGVWRETE